MRITARSLGALVPVMSPSAFNERIVGEARAVLANAQAVARAANVAYASVSVTSDRPCAAILDADEEYRHLFSHILNDAPEDPVRGTARACARGFLHERHFPHRQADRSG
jgi:hypothetical protein